MKILLSMANNSSTPYFNRFADIAKKQSDVELVFLCMYNEKPQMIDDMRERGFECLWVPYNSEKRKKSLIKSFFNIYRLLKEVKPDVVHSHLFDDSLPVLLAARLAGVKTRIISKLDAGFHFKYMPKWVFLDRFNNWNATKILAVSGENKKFILNKEKANSDKIVLIHQGVDYKEVTEFDKKEKKTLIEKYNLEGKKISLTVSRYIDWKGYKYIIEAAANLKDSIPDLHFVFIGYGEQQKELEEYAKLKGVSDIIIFTSWVNRKELNAFYNIASVFVHAAINEPFGYVIAEAMLNKIPVVTTKTGCAFDSIQHLEGGYLSDFHNSKHITQGISYMFEKDTSKLVNTSYEKAIKLFTVENMWENHVNLYKNSI